MRYKVLDLPRVGVGAFTPTNAINPIASSYGLIHVSGYPGTLPVPVNNPHNQYGNPPISAIAQTQPSNVSPDVILPSVYIPSALNMGPSQHVGMAARRLTPIPVPAVSWINTALQAMGGARIGGRMVTAWPRAFQRWSTPKGTAT